MKAFKIILIFIFCFLTCQLFADDKGTTTQKPKTIDITVVYLPDYPLPRTIVPSFSGELYGDCISLEADFPVGAVALQIVDADNQIVLEETVYFDGETVRINTESLEPGEYQLVLKVDAMTYKGTFRID